MVEEVKQATSQASKRKYIVGGNWKCNGTVEFVENLCRETLNEMFEEHLQEQRGQLLLPVEEDQVQGNQVQVEGNQLVLHVEDHGKWAS